MGINIYIYTHIVNMLYNNIYIYTRYIIRILETHNFVCAKAEEDKGMHRQKF